MRYSDAEVEAALRELDEVRVFIAAQDPLARAGVALLLGGQNRVGVVGQSALAEDWVSQAVASGARVVVLDGEALDEPMRTKIRSSTLPVVCLVKGDEQAQPALAAGARAVLGRDVDGPRLAAAVRAAMRGLLAIDDRLASTLVRDRPLPTPPAEALTAREVQVLQLLAEGLPNKLIAQRLQVSEHTAKFHVNAILAKLGAESRTEAVVRAARLGLVVL